MSNVENLLKTAEFALSANLLKQLPHDIGYEVAFAGRSNSGKSSVLNALCHHQGLARTSNTPGRTQHINVFKLDHDRRLTDLPGYGYAKVPQSIKEHWETVLDEYFRTRQCLRGIIVVMDIRHPLKPFDQVMLDWAQAMKIPIHILLNKADKLTRNNAKKTLISVEHSLQAYDGLHSAQVFSAETKDGLNDCYQVLKMWLSL
jgi:GTP-binding protein